MRKLRLLWVAALVWFSAGCCANPGLFQKINRSMDLVQSYYDPLIKDGWNRPDQWQKAVVAADTTLLLAGELQQQWCPDPTKTQQLELQAQEAKKLAQQIGVTGAGATSASVSMSAPQ